MPLHDSHFPKTKAFPELRGASLPLLRYSVIHLLHRLRPPSSQSRMAIVIVCPDRPPQSSLLSLCFAVCLLNHCIVQRVRIIGHVGHWLIACGPVDRRWKRYYKVLTKSMAELTIKKGLNRFFPEHVSSASPNSYIHTYQVLPFTCSL
ncbi:hypothetical protein L1887_32579 [Cichorium endivia]|nr:hypothetical protein L1887_32579 [Cichorium endivia]